jgi:glycine betaine catabolism B
MKFIDDFLNGITMYRLLLYGLLVVAALAIIFGFTGVLELSGTSLLASAAVLVGVSWVANILLARLFGAAPNTESALITGLILFCIFLPPQSVTQGAILALVATIAMASKYVLAIGKRHIFNPAAIAAVIVSLGGLAYAGWWVATDIMLPVTGILGLLILRKIHRFTMAIAFLAASLVAIFITTGDGQDLTSFLTNTFTTWPLVFFGAIMLTEPLTTPPTKNLQLIYGALVGALLGSGLHAGSIYMTPELALVIGNIFSFMASLRRRVSLTLMRKQEMAPGIFSFAFRPDAPIKHSAGQYLELTLPLKRTDSRGNRRTFTVASSPTEPEVQFGIKMNNPPSAFKKVLGELKEGGQVFTNQLAGDFTLPDDPKTKVICIAGGIGITPFRSMIKLLIDTNQSRDIVLFYQVAVQQQIVYRDILKAAESLDVKTVFVVTEKQTADLASTDYENGFITKEMIAKYAPDFKNRVCYVSGPPAMVKNYTKLLHAQGVKGVKTDYFPGY